METESKVSPIKEWIWFACGQNEVEELAQTIIIEWNSRFTRRMADAFYCPATYRARIRLSIPLWPRASEEQRRETIIHEVCHCVVWYKHGLLVLAHGGQWKQAMLRCGLEPVRCHSIDRTGLARSRRCG
jgi:SprT protein